MVEIALRIPTTLILYLLNNSVTFFKTDPLNTTSSAKTISLVPLSCKYLAIFSTCNSTELGVLGLFLETNSFLPSNLVQSKNIIYLLSILKYILSSETMGIHLVDIF